MAYIFSNYGGDKMRCAVYTRVSTDNQVEKEYNSCESQLEKIRSFIKSQEKMVVHEVYSDPGFTGDPIQYVQIVVTDTKGDRREEVSQEEYEAMPPDMRGTQLYFRREPSGREREVSREDYDRMEEARKGSIRYYRREVPRLAPPSETYPF